MGKRTGGGYHDIAEYYEHLIRTGRLRPGLILPTEVELAKQHGVTRTTIRRAFAGLVNKGLVTKTQGLGTRVALAADVESRAHSPVIVAMPQAEPDILIGGAFYRQERYQDALYRYVEALVTALADFSRPFRILYFLEDPASLDAMIAAAREANAPGIIAVDVHQLATVDRLAGCGMPVIFLDSHTHGRAVDAVKSDNVGGTREATEFLLRTTTGPLAYVGSSKTREEGSPHKERLDGFLEANRAAGRDVPSEYISICQVHERAAWLPRALALPAPPAGYMCCDDGVAADVIEWLHARHVAVPAAASVFGFGNLLSGLSASPAISTVKVDRRAMGLRAVEMLQARIDNPTAPPMSAVIPTELVLRQSTAFSPRETPTPAPGE